MQMGTFEWMTPRAPSQAEQHHEVKKGAGQAW